MTQERNDLVSEKCEICGLPVYASQGFNGLTLNHYECKKKVALTKKNRAEYEQALTMIFGNVKLHCDGFDVTLVVQQSKMKLSVMTYVNDVFEGVWMNPKDGFIPPQCTFLNKKIIRYWSYKKKADLIKKFGKKKAYELFDLDKQSSYYSPNWASGKQAISHLLKVCDSVEVYVDG